MRAMVSNLVGLGLLTLIAGAYAEENGWGSADDVAYAEKLVAELLDAKLVGPECIIKKPYKGTHPHGAVLDTVEAEITIGGHTGIAIVKRNFGGKDVTPEKVAAEPMKYFAAHTIMYKREQGYDPDNGDWFWVRAGGDNELSVRGGHKMAGKMEQACMACHRAAPGGDFKFLSD
ncbi:MAG: hypothetical protein OEU36_03275 [Gammaproteobacteria bacterium]|nr:hypothetical protein [Gammaproteobacteria bacterium]